MIIISGTRESAILRSGIREIIISNEPRYLGVKWLKGEYKMAPFFCREVFESHRDWWPYVCSSLRLSWGLNNIWISTRLLSFCCRFKTLNFPPSIRQKQSEISSKSTTHLLLQKTYFHGPINNTPRSIDYYTIHTSLLQINGLIFCLCAITQTVTKKTMYTQCYM